MALHGYQVNEEMDLLREFRGLEHSWTMYVKLIIQADRTCCCNMMISIKELLYQYIYQTGRKKPTNNTYAVK
jgi:hypothetical protein